MESNTIFCPRYTFKKYFHGAHSVQHFLQYVHTERTVIKLPGAHGVLHYFCPHNMFNKYFHGAHSVQHYFLQYVHTEPTVIKISCARGVHHTESNIIFFHSTRWRNNFPHVHIVQQFLLYVCAHIANNYFSVHMESIIFILFPVHVVLYWLCSSPLGRPGFFFIFYFAVAATCWRVE